LTVSSNINAAGANITGNANVGNLGATGNISAAYFVGDGGFLSNITISLGSSLNGGNSNITVAANANITMGVSGNANIVVVTGTGVVINGTANISGNANIGNLTTNTAIITTGNITTINSGTMQNGTSNIRIVNSGNVTTSVVGNANVFTVTGTGVVVSGTAATTGNILLGNTTESQTNTSYTSTNFAKIVVRPSFDFNNSGTITSADAIALNNYVGGVAAYTLNTNPPPYVLNHADNRATGMMVLPAEPLAYATGGTSNGAVWLTSGNINGNGVASYMRVGYTTGDSQDVYIKAANATVSGNLTATYFKGDGSQLTNLTIAAGTAIVNGTSNVTVAASSNVTINVTAANSYTFSTGAILPNANGTQNLGGTSNYFNVLYGKSTSAQYADLAEKYRADADYEPGTVLMLGGEFEVTECDSPRNNRVFGCVSTNPAYLMNDGEKEGIWLPVVLTGRTPIKVIGPVVKGTRLVSAGNGAAMGAGLFGSDYQIEIGRSLEDKETEEMGLIEAYISTK
jgi:hypothetical protein